MSETEAPEPTGKPQDRRKLIAVLHADVVGYSHLIGLDDVGTLERLGTLRRTLIDPAISEHGGRRTLTPVIVPTALPYRNPEHREIYLTGLRLALDQEP